MTKFLFRLLLASIVAVLAAAYFYLALPLPVAVAIGIGLGLLELISPLTVNRSSGASGTARVMGPLFKIAAPLILWPGLAWTIEHLAGVPPHAAIAAGAGVSAMAGLFAAGHGQGRDSARLWGVIVALLCVLYASAQSVSGGYFAGAVGAGAAALGLMSARRAIVWSEQFQAGLDYATISAFAGAVICAAVAVFQTFA